MAKQNDRKPGGELVSNISNYFSRKLGFGVDRERDSSNEAGSSQPARFLKTPTIDCVVEYIRSDNCRNIIFMIGAGISTAAGIPDFRSPSSGLYAKLDRFNLPTPEVIFEIHYFKKNPAPFFALARELMPQKLKPTKAHHFLKLMHEKGLLLRVYSQNIDSLETKCGIPENKLVEVHGTFKTSHCLSCKKEYSFDWLKAKMSTSERVPKCTECHNVIKPDIVFFGESLPPRFFKLVDEDFANCDLLVIIGTSLQVQPFASLVYRVHAAVPRLLINLEKCGQNPGLAKMVGIGCSLDFDSKRNYRDVAMLGTCDERCEELAKRLGWEEDLKRIIANHEESSPAD